MLEALVCSCVSWGSSFGVVVVVVCVLCLCFLVCLVLLIFVLFFGGWRS